CCIRASSNWGSLPTRATPTWALRHKSLSPTSAMAASNLCLAFSMRLLTTLRFPFKESFSGMIKVRRAAATIMSHLPEAVRPGPLPYSSLWPTVGRAFQDGLHFLLDIGFDNVSHLKVAK